MKKVALFFLALALLVGFIVKDLEAGQLCWQITGSDNYITVSVVKPDPLYPYKSLNGMWYSPSSSTIIPVVGTMVKNNDGTTSRLTLHGTLLMGSDVWAYALDATIDNVTKSGTLYIYYDMSESNTSWTLTKVNCATAPAP